MIAISIGTMTCVLLNKFHLSIFIILCVIRTYTIWRLNNAEHRWRRCAHVCVLVIVCNIWPRRGHIYNRNVTTEPTTTEIFGFVFSAEHSNTRFERTDGPMANANFILDEIVAMIITAPVDSWYCTAGRVIACTLACERRKCHSFASMWSIRKPMGGNEVSSRECEPIFYANYFWT